MADVLTWSDQDPYSGSMATDLDMMVPGYDPMSYAPPPNMGMAPISPIVHHDPTPTPDVTTANDPYLRLGSYTPDTEVGVIPREARPDISLYCDGCCKHISLKLLLEHRAYHKALKVMQYRSNTHPDSVDALKHRRTALIQKLRTKGKVDDTMDTVRLQQLNEAYEFLKADLDDTFDGYRRVIEQTDTTVQGLALNCSTLCAPVVAMCSHGNERWKSHMEDTRVFQDYFGNDPAKCFFALYDGHSGRFAAEVAANELHHFLLLEMEKFDPRTKCTCTFNMAEHYDITEYNLVAEIHTRPTSAYSERGLIHEESTNVIQQIIRTCEAKLSTIDQEAEKSTPENSENLDPNTSVKPTSAKDKKERKKRDKDPFAEKMGKAFKKAHKCTDMLLSYGKDESSRVRWSGTSTLACVIQNTKCTEMTEGLVRPGLDKSDTMLTSTPSHLLVAAPASPRNNLLSAHSRATSDKSTVEPPRELGIIHLANAGNSHAVLVRGDRAYKLTRDHTPSNTREKTRIIKAGGSVNEGEHDLRVNGILATTRSLGNHGDRGLKRCVVTEPYTTSVQIDQYAQFLVLATNGVWEIFSEHEAAAILLEMLPVNHVPPPSQLGSSLNFIYGVTESPTNSDLQSRNSDVYSDITEAPLVPRNMRRDQSESYKKVFGNLKSKSNVRISDEKIRHEGSDSSSHTASVPQTRSIHTIADDLQTEIGSHAASDGEDSGNEADVETDFVTISSRSRQSERLAGSGDKRQEFAKSMSERLVQAALLAGAKDNVSVMVILLPAAQIS